MVLFGVMINRLSKRGITCSLRHHGLGVVTLTGGAFVAGETNM